jgi:predicted Zn-ribbon and HTH transcriptional regulator
MSFRCPQCKTRDTLQIVLSLDLPPDRQTEELSLQVVACRDCGFRALAVYEVARGDCPESESWKHIGYWVSPDAIESVSAAIRSCPEQRNPHCACAAHASLGKKDLRGKWSGLLELERGHTFAMRLFIG